MKVTMSDVAKAAGVDKATVSRALKGDPRISEKTRALVMDSVRTLGYRPDLNARHLSTNRSGFIGLLLRELNAPGSIEFISGLDRAISNSEYDLLIKCTDGDPRRAARELAKLSDRDIEGLIWEDSENLPKDISVPLLTIGFKHSGSISLLSEDGGRLLTFETGALAGRLLLTAIMGRPVPTHEVIIRNSKGE